MTRDSSETDYERKIETFTYLTEAAITIPKAVRERAFELAIDIKIIRTEVPQYANFRSTPDSGFYGYVNLILDDFSLEAMKISQPRQRIWKQIRTEAYSAWTDWMYAESLRRIINKNKDAICSLSAGLAILSLACAPAPCVATPTPIFREIDLREVYIECDKSTRFQVEISWVQMRQISDSCGNVVTPSSGQSDDKKDRGLPPEGVKPSNGNRPNSPASAGLPPISSPSDLGSFANDKLEGLDNIPLDNEDKEGWGTFLRITGTYTTIRKPCAGQPFSYDNYRLVHSLDTSATVTYMYDAGNTCNQELQAYSVSCNHSGVVTSNVIGIGAPSVSIVIAPSMPVSWSTEN